MSDLRVLLDFVTGRVIDTANEAAEEAAAKVAFAIEAQTKVNIRDNGQVDTGFMMNSCYTVNKRGGGSYGRTWRSGLYRSKRTGQTSRRTINGEAGLGGAQAAIVVGADYAIYQEQKNSFLYRAAEQVIPRAGYVIGAAFKTFGF